MINWDQIDTVLLDLDGTLLDLHFDNYFWLTHFPMRYAEHHNLDAKDSKAQLLELIQSYEGTLQWYCLDHWSDLVGMDIMALKQEVEHKIQPRPHTIAFLDYLKTTGKKTILATNAHRKGLTLKFQHTEIELWLDKVISSHDYQHPKEDNEFWQILAKNEELDLDRTLFIDDNISVLRAAKAFGFKNLVCVTQPDSQKPIKRSLEFIDIVDFNEIMPSVNVKP